MRSRLIHDLTSWEQGELSLEALSARHQDAGVTGTIALHHTFTQVTAHEVAPPTAQQVERLLARLPERAVRGSVLSALHTSTSRKVVAVLTSILMSGGVAYAAGYTPVKERVDSVLRGITSLFDGSKGDEDRKGSDGNPSGEPAGAGGSGMVGGSPGSETTPASTGSGQDDGSSGTDPSGDDRPAGEDGEDGEAGEAGDDATPDDHEGDGGTDDDKGDDAKPDGDDVDEPDPDDGDDVDEPDEDVDTTDDTSADTDDDLNVDDDISEDNGGDDPDDDAGGNLPVLHVSEWSETR